MKKVIIIVVLFLNLWNSTFSQENSNTYSKWYVKPAFGLNIPLTKLLSGEITDNLFEYSDNSIYWQILSANYFFSAKWGIEFTYQAGCSQRISSRFESFKGKIEEEFGDKYFVSTSSGAEYNNFSIIGGSIERGYLGLVYRYEKPNYVFLPKLLIGVTSFYTDWGSAHLKEKGSNTFYKLFYNSGERPNDHYIIAPSFTFGYRLNRRLIANFDLLYSCYKTDIEFVKEMRNTFTEEIAIETIDYKKNIHTLSVGFGLIIELKPATSQ